MLGASTEPEVERGINEHDLKARVDEVLNRRPAVGLAVGVVRDGRLEFFHGHGLADIAANTPVTEDTIFRIASITKTFTAIAVMQLWEQGLIDLDGPANDYLRAYRLIPARTGFRPATVRHLLTHTAGIREVLHPSGLLRMRDLGETVKLGRPVPSLAEYYRGGLRIDAEPGTRFMYTDHGFATLGQLVEDVSGKPLDRYLRGTWLATWRPCSAAAPTSTAQCSNRRRWPPCSSPTTSLIPGCRVSAWGSSGSTSVAISQSSTMGSSPVSTRRSSWLPTTEPV
jgi:CubicO group peptidase (beta-lactamase class C family)